MGPRSGHPPLRGNAIAAVALTAVLSTWALSQAPTPAVEGVVVLTNGSVLHGSIERHGDAYHIVVAGAQLRVPAEQVERFAPTLAEAYDARRRDLPGDSAEAHIELARWCLNQGLLAEAARELLDARTLEPGHRGAAIIEVQLRHRMELERRRGAAPTAGIATPVTAETADTGTSAETVPLDIPAEAQSLFVRQIQPMLVRTCASSGCHRSGGEQEFALDPWVLEGRGNAQLTRRNLHAVLRHVNVENPAASPLLNFAKAPHGSPESRDAQALAERQVEILAAWLNQVAGLPPVPVASTEGVPMMFDAAVAPAAFTMPADEAAPAELGGADQRPSRFQPRDEFDAEIFNRRRPAVDRAELPSSASVAGDAPVTDPLPEPAPESPLPDPSPAAAE
jgi:hypothetical protein